jgi:hypothetical protein
MPYFLNRYSFIYFSKTFLNLKLPETLWQQNLQYQQWQLLPKHQAQHLFCDVLSLK